MPRLSRSRLIAVAVAAALLVAGLGRSTARAEEIERFNRELPANQEGWVDAGIDLREGDYATFVSFGRASWDGGHTGSGPEGVQIEWCAPLSVVHKIGALLARAGSNPVMAAVEGETVTGPGRLMVAYNDCPGQFFDNSGTFSMTITVTRVAPIAPSPDALPQPQAAPVQKPDKQGDAGSKSGGIPILPIVLLLALAGGGTGGYFLLRRVVAARRPRFDPSARLESSAWLAPVRLADLQGESMPKRFLTVGGPDADIDFGVPGVWARLVPMDDGGTRIEMAGEVKISVNGMPLILGQRLGNGQRVKVGVREFVFLEERQPNRPLRPERPDGLDKPDPRVAA